MVKFCLLFCFVVSLAFVVFGVPITDSASATLIRDILDCNIPSFKRALLLGQILQSNVVGGFDSFACPPEDTTISSGENYAFGWTATASSNQSGQGPSSAVDGKTECPPGDLNGSHVNAEMNPWWMVDMGRQVCVRRVVIYNTADCCGRYGRVFTVSVSQERDGDSEVCGRFVSTTGEIETIRCNKPIYGRFVKVQTAGWSHLVLCEVEVFSSAERMSTHRPFGFFCC